MRSTQVKFRFYLYWPNIISVQQYISETNKYHPMIKNACDYKTFFLQHTRQYNSWTRTGCGMYTGTLRTAVGTACTCLRGHLAHRPFGPQQYPKPRVAAFQNPAALHASARFWAAACSLSQGFACTLYIIYFHHEHRSSYCLKNIHHIPSLA